MKKFFRRLMGDKTWYSFFEYESLPIFQELCLESKKLLDVHNRLISKLTDNNLGEFKDQNDQQLYDSIQEQVDEISKKRCRIEGKILANKFISFGPPSNDYICNLTIEIPSKGLGVPSTLDFSIQDRKHGRSQLNYVYKLKKGQTIRLHAAFYCNSQYSAYGVDDHQVIISNT